MYHVLCGRLWCLCCGMQAKAWQLFSLRKMAVYCSISLFSLGKHFLIANFKSFPSIFAKNGKKRLVIGSCTLAQHSKKAFEILLGQSKKTDKLSPAYKPPVFNPLELLGNVSLRNLVRIQLFFFFFFYFLLKFRCLINGLTTITPLLNYSVSVMCIHIWKKR